MKNSIKLEEVGLFLLGIFLFNELHYKWWWFVLLLLAPDISMIGYVFGNKTGAISYNIFHHRGIAILVYMSGIYLSNEQVQFAGVLLFSHSSMDRIFGYGLKYATGFKHTHLGNL
jgi:hypothetical protein